MKKVISVLVIMAVFSTTVFAAPYLSPSEMRGTLCGIIP